MPQHFLLTAAARTLTLASVARMSDEEAERVFIRLRWSDNNGDAYCPHCGCPTVYMARRPNGAPRWRCKACRKDFSVTSGTLFAFHKLPLRSYLLAIAIFCNEVKGKSMLALSRDLGVQYKIDWLSYSVLDIAEARRPASFGGARPAGQLRLSNRADCWQSLLLRAPKAEQGHSPPADSTARGPRPTATRLRPGSARK